MRREESREERRRKRQRGVRLLSHATHTSGLVPTLHRLQLPSTNAQAASPPGPTTRPVLLQAHTHSHTGPRPHLVATVVDLHPRPQAPRIIPQRHDEGVHTVVIQRTAAVRGRHLGAIQQEEGRSEEQRREEGTHRNAPSEASQHAQVHAP